MNRIFTQTLWILLPLALSAGCGSKQSSATLDQAAAVGSSELVCQGGIVGGAFTIRSWKTA